MKHVLVLQKLLSGCCLLNRCHLDKCLEVSFRKRDDFLHLSGNDVVSMHGEWRLARVLASYVSERLAYLVDIVERHGVGHVQHRYKKNRGGTRADAVGTASTATASTTAAARPRSDLRSAASKK